jgi:hypothetical protein
MWLLRKTCSGTRVPSSGRMFWLVTVNLHVGPVEAVGARGSLVG